MTKELAIVINGARENNLKNLSLSIPKNQVVVITGPSGSGKSSLAFDTIHAESQWRFIESLSQSSKFFINKLPRPDVDSITGLNPSIALKQGLISSAGRNVGSFLDLNSQLSNLFVLHSKAQCPKCNAVLKTSTVQSIVDEFSASSSKLEILAPVEIKDYEQLVKLRETGIVRLKIDNVDYRLDEGLEQIPLGLGYIVFDRLKPGNSSRFYDSVESSMKLGRGRVSIMVDEHQLLNYQEYARCENCSIDMPELKNKIFSEGDLEKVKLFKINSYTYLDLVSAKLSDLTSLLDSLKVDVSQVKSKLLLLNDLNLGDLKLERDLSTLSSGELQRLRLASLFAADLTGVIYVLDEPSAYLDPLGVKKVLGLISKFKVKGNSLLIVDHHPEIIKSADYIIEIGPTAGVEGGKITAQGTYHEISINKQTLTNKYIHQKRRLPTVSEAKSEEIQIDFPEVLGEKILKFPSNCLVTLYGDSGVGKTKLLLNGIVPKIAKFAENPDYQGPKFNRVINLDSSYSLKTLRSNPASLLEVFSSIRSLFAGVSDSKIRGFTPSRFSFNTKGGRCEDCQGAGVNKLDIDMLTDVYSKCSTCDGMRYNRDTLSIKYRGLNIHDVLNLSIAEAANFFRQIPDIYSKLTLACEVGVSYLSLGQAANTISGGEYQRLKVAEALNSNTKTLFVLDEPCLGLHASDVEVLVKLLNRITAKGNSVIVATNNADLIFASQYLVELTKNGLGFSGSHQDFIKSEKSINLGLENYYKV